MLYPAPEIVPQSFQLIHNIIHNIILNKILENQIDQLVYKLYDLTPEEINIVEGFNEKNDVDSEITIIPSLSPCFTNSFNT